MFAAEKKEVDRWSCIIDVMRIVPNAGLGLISLELFIKKCTSIIAVITRNNGQLKPSLTDTGHVVIFVEFDSIAVKMDYNRAEYSQVVRP